MLIVRLIGRIWKMKRMVSSGNQNDDSREREKKKKIALVIYIRACIRPAAMLVMAIVENS